METIYITTELRGFRPSAFLCTLEVSAMQSVYDIYIYAPPAAGHWC